METQNYSSLVIKYNLAILMSQMSFSDFQYTGKPKKTHRERFLIEKDHVVR